MMAVRIVALLLLAFTIFLIWFEGRTRAIWPWLLAGLWAALALDPRPLGMAAGTLGRYNLGLVDGLVAVLAVAALALGLGLASARRRSEQAFRVINQLVDEQAVEDFAREYGQAAFHPVTVVIPAYYEADNIGGVLASIPRTVHGMPVSVLVVVDGSRDGTDAVVRRHGDYVAMVRVNRGQGAALRVGYRLAIAHGARYVVTLDADGQYIPAEMPALVEPLVSGEADYVQGSRRLGTYQADDPVRVLGVHFFGWLIQRLTKQPISDSSNGFRAIKTEVLERLRLTEDQYHAAELLLLAMRQGFRVVERPASMRPRTSGTTKKGHNLLYGYHYARVIFKSWFRTI